MDRETELLRAAEFLGLKTNMDMFTLHIKDKGPFNPHEEEGRHWLVKIEKKMSLEQWDIYIDSMVYASGNNTPDFKWLKTAPSSLCFKKIIQAITGVYNG